MGTIFRIICRRCSTFRKKYDAVVIGGGHNGLVAAAYMQKNGFQVCVLERREILGGAAVTEEIIPGFKFSRASYVLSLLRPQIYDELKLQEFGLRVLPRNPSSYTPLQKHLWQGQARSLTLGTDSVANAKEIGKFSEADAAAFPEYEAQLARLAAAIEPLLDVAPSLAIQALDGSLAARVSTILRDSNLRKSLKQFLNLKSETVALFELLTAPPLKLLKRWFESEVLIATLAMDAVIGTVESPNSPGTGYVLLLHSMLGECDGGRGRWGYPVGGMGAVSQSIAASAQQLGVDIFTNQDVESILLDGSGRACGVRTTDGREVAAKLVLSNATPQVTFFKLLPSGVLSQHEEKSLRGIDYSSGVAKINVAVKELPSFLADPNSAKNKAMPHHQATIHVNSERVCFLEDAYRDLQLGRCSERPLIEMVIPSVVDPSVAPNGGHVVLMFTQYAAYNGDREDYAKRVFRVIDEYAPGFSDSVLGKEVLMPEDLENIFQITGGNIFHGAMSPDRLFLLRPSGALHPAPYTPIPGLFLCGSGAHPGGGVSGAPGRIAGLEAVAVLSRSR